MRFENCRSIRRFEKELVDDIKYRPPIFRKKTENEEKCANFKGKIQFYREIQL